MKIKDKEQLKIEIKGKITKFTKEFPFYFFVNIFINIFLLIIIFLIFFLFFLIARQAGEVIFLVFIVMGIMTVTFKNFLRNIKILHGMYNGDYDFEIDDHEMDNAIEFLEDLPLNISEVNKLRISLSFNKIINVLESSGIITKKKGVWDVDLDFKYKAKSLEGDYLEDYLKQQYEKSKK